MKLAIDTFTPLNVSSDMLTLFASMIARPRPSPGFVKYPSWCMGPTDESVMPTLRTLLEPERQLQRTELPEAFVQVVLRTPKGTVLEFRGPLHAPPTLILRPVAPLVGAVPPTAVVESVIVPLTPAATVSMRAM